MAVDYRTDDVGIEDFYMEGTEQDFTGVKVRGEVLHRRVTGYLQTTLFGKVAIAWTITKKGMAVDQFGILVAPKGRTVNAPMMTRLAEEYPRLLRDALWKSHSMHRKGDERTDGKRLDALWIALTFAMEPARASGETMSEYVYRLWVEMYEPEGRNQKELAADLAKTHQLVRRYISAERQKQGKRRK